MSDDETRVWLRREASPKTLEETANARGWTLIADELRTHSTPAIRVFRTEGGAEVGWHEDHPLGVRHLWISGPGADSLRASLEALIPHWTREGLLGELKSDDLCEVLSGVRVLSCIERDDLSSELRNVLEKLMEHPNKIVRRAVLHLCWANGWPQMLAAVRARAKDDGELGEEWQRLAEILEDV